MSSKKTIYVIVKFYGDNEEVSVIQSSTIKNCPDSVDQFEKLINQDVKVRSDGKKGNDEYYKAKVLAYSHDRPQLVALLGTYLKTGFLTTPTNSKRGRIPKTVDSSSESDSGLCHRKSPDLLKKAKKIHKMKKESASLVAAKDILAQYGEQAGNNSANETIDTMAALRQENAEQATTISKLKKQLKEMTAERDSMLETREANIQIAADLRRSLKYANRLQATLSSSPSSSASSCDSEASSGSLPLASSGLEHEHLLCLKADPGVVQLGKSSIFVNGSNFSSVMHGSTSSTMLARNLLELVFTPKALRSCSVRGRKANGLGTSATTETRDPLYQPGINAIIDFTICHGKTSHWKVQDPSTVVTAMGKRLNEIRASVKISTANLDCGEIMTTK